MIQRVQTLFLVVVAACMFALLFFPIWGQQNATKVAELTVSKLQFTENGSIKEETNTIYLAVLAVFSSILAVASIFSYKSRAKQMLINMFNSLVIGGTLVACTFLMFEGEELFNGGQDSKGLGIGFFLIGISLFANMLANRFIKNDEKLVRSSDRLR